MKLRVREGRKQAGQFIKDGQPLAAIRLLVSMLRTHPDDYEARMALADALAVLGASEQAAQVYHAVAILSVEGGRPLMAIVASRAMESLGLSRADVIDRLAELYGEGSSRLADIGARLNVSNDELRVDSRALNKECSVAELVEEAVEVGKDLRGVGSLPERFFPIPMLSELSPARLAALVRALEVHRLRPGHVVMREGDRGKSCFLVVRGQVRVLVQGAGGQDEVVASLSDGAIFGEMSLISGQPRTATIQVVRDTDLLELGPAALAAIGDELSKLVPALDRLAHKRSMANLFRQCPIFQIFSATERRELLKRCQAIEVRGGTMLYSQDEPSRGIYLVVRGEVGMTRRTVGQPPRLLSRLGPGAMFGRESVINNTPSWMTATSLSPCTVLFLSRRYVHRLIEAVPEFQAAVFGESFAREISQAC